MNKFKNIRIFEDTMQVIKNSTTYSNMTERAKELTMLYEKAVDASPEFKIENPVEVSVTEERTIECALRLLEEIAKIGRMKAGPLDPCRRVAILNFASPRRPGGGVLTGASAQEEAICRITNLYPCLAKIKVDGIFYSANVKSPYTDKTLYTRNVAIIKSDDDKPVLLRPMIDEADVEWPCDSCPGRASWICDEMNDNCGYWQDYKKERISRTPIIIDVVTCAAPNQKGISIPNDELYAIIRRRLAIVLSACLENGAGVIVLGAWGCGAFRNPPEVVAKAMIDEIRENFNKSFYRIVFAVYCPGRNKENYETFAKVIKQKGEGDE